jgi:hypothetical protein
MSKYEGATIEVVNFLSYNPRSDAKRPSWFRLENTIATGPGFSDLDCEQKWLWVFILSLVSQSNGRPIVWKSGYCMKMTGIKPDKQDKTIEIFEQFTRLRVCREVTLPDSPATYERTDGRTDMSDSDESSLPPLAKIWNQYRKTLPEVKACGASRKRIAEARWREKPATEYWSEIVDRITRSSFCCGKNDRGWRADFDFFIRPETHNKVLEGKYDDHQSSQPKKFMTIEELKAKI